MVNINDFKQEEKPISKNHQNWGLDRAEASLKNCK